MSDQPIQQNNRPIITPQMRGARLATVRPPRNQPYVHQPYPATRYHPDGATAIVQNEEEDYKLGPDWARFPFPPPPKPPEPPKELTAEQWKAKFTEARAEIRALEAYAAEKAAEVLTLQKELRESQAQIADLREDLAEAKPPAAPAEPPATEPAESAAPAPAEPKRPGRAAK